MVCNTGCDERKSVPSKRYDKAKLDGMIDGTQHDWMNEFVR